MLMKAIMIYLLNTNKPDTSADRRTHKRIVAKLF